MNLFWIRYLPPFLAKWLDGRQSAQKVIANTGWLMADRVIRMAVGLAVGVWLARFLGPEQLGAFQYAIAFVSLWGTVATLGFDGVIVRELVRSAAPKDEILGSTFMTKLAGGVLALVLSVTAILILRPGDATLHWLVAILAAGTVFQSLDVIDFWFQSRVESRFGIYAKSGAFLIVSAVKIVLILQNAPLIAFAAAASVEVLLGALGLLLMYRMSGNKISAWRLKMNRAADLLRESWPLAIASVAVMVYMKIDQIMLGQMLGNREVGVYSAAIRFSEIWYFIPVAIVASIAPSLTEARRIDPGFYYQRLSSLFRLMLGIALAIAIPMTFAAGHLTRTVYGGSYDGAAPILAIHIWAVPFVFLGVAQSPWTINEGMAIPALWRAVCGGVANIILNLFLIPVYGAIGAAVATVVSYAMSAVFLNALSSRTRPIFFLQMRAMAMLPQKQ